MCRGFRLLWSGRGVPVRTLRTRRRLSGWRRRSGGVMPCGVRWASLDAEHARFNASDGTRRVTARPSRVVIRPCSPVPCAAMCAASSSPGPSYRDRTVRCCSLRRPEPPPTRTLINHLASTVNTRVGNRPDQRSHRSLRDPQPSTRRQHQRRAPQWIDRTGELEDNRDRQRLHPHPRWFGVRTRHTASNQSADQRPLPRGSMRTGGTQSPLSPAQRRCEPRPTTAPPLAGSNLTAGAPHSSICT